MECFTKAKSQFIKDYSNHNITPDCSIWSQAALKPNGWNPLVTMRKVQTSTQLLFSLALQYECGQNVAARQRPAFLWDEYFSSGHSEKVHCVPGKWTFQGFCQEHWPQNVSLELSPRADMLGTSSTWQNPRTKQPRGETAQMSSIRTVLATVCSLLSIEDCQLQTLTFASVRQVSLGLLLCCPLTHLTKQGTAQYCCYSGSVFSIWGLG